MSSSEQSFNGNISSSEELTPNSNNKDENIPIQNMEKVSTGSKEGCACGHGSNTIPKQYVYAMGKIVPRFPNKSIEAEFAQATGLHDQEALKGKTHAEIFNKIVTNPNNRYIARQVCYVFTIEGLETYILVPSDPLDIDRLAQAVRPNPKTDDVDLIIGRRGPISPREMCNGLMVPIVMVDQIYSFDRDNLMFALPKQKGDKEDQYKKTAEQVFNKITQLADNAGAIDEHRALNYLAVRYDEIYRRTQELQNENYSFSAVEVRLSRLSGTRKIFDVVFSYENRANRAIQKWFARVDVTEEFPFLVSPLQEYFER